MHPRLFQLKGRVKSGLLFTFAAMLASCSSTALFNLTAANRDFGPNGQPTPRTLSVGFINNTPFRAIFTFGGYDQLNEDGLPLNFGQLRLEGNTTSNTVSQPCRKTFSVGGDELIRLIEVNIDNPLIVVTDQQALVRGVNFSSAPANSPLAASPTEGTAEGVALLAGIDYACIRPSTDDPTGTGLLLITFEQDAMAPGGFRVDSSFLPP